MTIFFVCSLQFFFRSESNRRLDFFSLSVTLHCVDIISDFSIGKPVLKLRWQTLNDFSYWYHLLYHSQVLLSKFSHVSVRWLHHVYSTIVFKISFPKKSNFSHWHPYIYSLPQQFLSSPSYEAYASFNPLYFNRPLLNILFL